MGWNGGGGGGGGGRGGGLNRFYVSQPSNSPEAKAAAFGSTDYPMAVCYLSPVICNLP